MRRFYTILSFIFCFISLFAQQLTVESFVKLDYDMSARTVEPLLDQNGKKCAIIKVITTEPGFSFDVGMLGVQHSEQRVSEYWVYVPEHTAKIKIMHPTLGQLKTETNDGYYWFPLGHLQEATVYRLELTISYTGQEKDVKMGYLVLTSTPSGADVYLSRNGEEKLVGQTPFSDPLPYGSYTFRLLKDMYHPEVGIAKIDQYNVDIAATLRPAFGSIKVETQPSGATVQVEGIDDTFSTPCTINKVPSGEVTVTISKESHNSVTQRVHVDDGQVTPVNVTLTGRYGNLTVKSLKGAQILIDGTACGRTTWSGQLVEGVHTIEVRMAGHKAVTDKITIGDKDTLERELNPLPLYGSLDITTVPYDAHVELNGRDYGMTPTIIPNLLVGTYTLTLSKSGFAAITKRITVKENQTVKIKENLVVGKRLQVVTGQAGDRVFIDNQQAGATPLTYDFQLGEHTIYAVRGEKRTETITVNIQQTTNAIIQLSFEKIGALKGVFSVSPHQKVVFSKGNLCYRAATNKFYFAERQYDVIGARNATISETNRGFIDLFGWGTATDPTKSSPQATEYTNFVDWGTQPIVNGGNGANQWRTLTKDEWHYLRYQRNNAEQRFCVAQVDGINGVIFLPDYWTNPRGVPTWNPGEAKQEGANSYKKQNVYTAEQWQIMEDAGAVFLPTAGYRNGTDVNGLQTTGYYWSSTAHAVGVAYTFYINSNSVCISSGNCAYGVAVRLVADYKP